MDNEPRVPCPGMATLKDHFKAFYALYGLPAVKPFQAFPQPYLDKSNGVYNVQCSPVRATRT